MKQGIYEQVINNMTARQLAELDLAQYDIGTDPLDAEEARKFLANYISTVTRKALSIVREQASEDTQVLAQIRICNEIISTLKNCLGPEEADELALDERGRVLTYVYAKLNNTRGMRGPKSEKPARPSTPLSQSSLFTGSHAEPRMMSELKHEILTADRIDFLVSFIRWSGIRLLIDELREFTSHGGQLRIMTTTYMEATDYKAIEELSQLQNTQIKISYDTQRTRLHAKAYVFHRDTGFTTAYIGSSNISNPALTSGLEWNLKVTEQDSYDVLKRIEATYEGYWNTQEFHQFELHSEHATQQLKTALQKKNSEGIDLHFGFEITPYEYQKEVLDKLAAERTLYNRTKNLIVAATGKRKHVHRSLPLRAKGISITER